MNLNGKNNRRFKIEWHTLCMFFGLSPGGQTVAGKMQLLYIYVSESNCVMYIVCFYEFWFFCLENLWFKWH